MKKIGLIAGMSWESSAVYYRHINRLANQKMGGLHSAEIIMHSVDYEPFLQLSSENKWDTIGERTSAIAENLAAAGADCILICCNTVHLIAHMVEQKLSIPLLHIVDPCGEAIKKNGLKKIGLIGTHYTMERDFFKRRLEEKYGIETVIPEDKDRKYLNNAIKSEFCKGLFYPETKREVIEIIKRLEAMGAEGVILGCTEIPILIQVEDCSIPTFDTTFLHSEAALEFALS